MQGRVGIWIAWAVVATYWALVSAGFVLRVLNDPAADLGSEIQTRVSWGAYPTVGALILARQPRNPIGWLCCAVGLVGPAFFGQDYAWYALIHHAGELPGGLIAAWLGQWPWGVAIGLPMFVLLLFPDGRLVSPGWRPVAWAGAANLAALWFWGAFAPRPLEAWGLETRPNPLGIPLPAPVWAMLEQARWMVGLLAILSAVSMVVRFRRAREVQRQQLKWFTYAALMSTLTWIVFFPTGLAEQFPSLLENILGIVWLGSVPAAIGIAMLRYRLYDIDRLINRTLVYGLLTTVLGGGYAAVVLLAGQAVGGLGESPPSWLVAGATLAVALLFQPTRRRIQAAVDRRFNRRRYHAAQTLQTFSSRLRAEIDLDTLRAELLTVVEQTMEPTAVSLWLRSPSAPKTTLPGDPPRGS